MNSNSISVLLGCVGLAVGSIGLVAQDIRGADQRSTNAEPQERVRAAAWPPHPMVAGVEFHDQLLQLISLGPPPSRSGAVRQPEQDRAEVGQPETSRQETRGGPPESGANISQIRTVRFPGSRRIQAVEIEFIEHDGTPSRRLYPVSGQKTVSGNRRDEFVPEQAMETYGYSPRRSRRSGRGYHRRWRW